MSEFLTSKDLVEYRGRLLEQQSESREWVGVFDDGGSFPDAISRRDLEGRVRVRVPWDQVARLFRRVVSAQFDGERVEIYGVHEDTVGIFLDRNPKLAAKHGLKGSLFESGGFYGRVPREAISEISVTERDRQLPGRPR